MIDFGFFRLQASDLGKLALVLVLSHFLAVMQRHTLPNKFPLYRLRDRKPFIFTDRGWIDCREGFVKPVGVLLGTMGYATGTYLAYIVGTTLRAMAG